jgi:aminomethyltransferase
MPLRYSSDLAEHTCVRTRAGLFDLSHMGEIEVTGHGAAELLDYALVGHPSAMALGQARYNMICAEDGGILDDLVVYRLEATRFVVVANASNAQAVVAALTARGERIDADVTDATENWALLALQGPQADEILSNILARDLSSIRYYSVVQAELLGHEVLLARTGYTGEDGFEVYCRPDAATPLWTGLLEAGRPHGVAPAGLACRDTLRLEAGMPLYGHELTRNTSPFDVGLGRVVHFGKPRGFVGDEALKRHQESPSSQLVGLASEGRRAPRNGYAVLDDAGDLVLGRITSGAPSPTLGHPIAMALVAPGVTEPGMPLNVNIRGHLETVQAVPMPFYRRPTH